RPMSIHDALTTISSENAKQFAEEYFALDARYPGVGRYTGAHFESLGEDQNRPNQITASDLLAVGTLSVNVPARAAIGILGDLLRTSQPCSRRSLRMRGWGT